MDKFGSLSGKIFQQINK